MQKVKSIIVVLLLWLPMIATAQNTWEMPEEEAQTEETVKINPDQKYLAGAVPVVDGRVVFSATIDAPGKSAAEVYAIVLKYMTKMTTERNQLETSRIALADSVKHVVAGTYQEWLVFRSAALILDRTRFFFTLVANCSDGKAEITLSRIHYKYEEERNPQSLNAEEWITDEYALRKSKQKLAPITGKFRRKTIDRKDYLFDKFTKLLQ